MPKVFRSGNSKVVSLPDRVLKDVGISLGDEVSIEVYENEIRLSSLKKKFQADPEIHRLTQKIIKKYRPALEKLAQV
ncbi:MAG: AbrB/MazE/SpoVT family DNA-binding domain-containing protein [Patescibacteria group bacterium]